jgi:glutamine synthetase
MLSSTVACRSFRKQVLLAASPRRFFRSTTTTRSSDTNVEALQSSLAEKGVKYCLASYVDIHGVSKSKMVPLAHLPRMLKGSELCTGAALDGVPQDVSDEEVSPVPDTDSVIICPWGNRDVAWFASDLYCDGKKFQPCSRNIFKRVLSQAEEMGFGFDLGIEPEFFILKSSDTANNQSDANAMPMPIGDRDVLAKPAYDVRTTLDSLEMLSKITDALASTGYDVYSFDHEDAIGQFEIDFKFFDGLQMADRYVFFRLLCSEVAHEHAPGAYASFMPKPFADRAGSGAHYNMNLVDLETGKNLFKVDKTSSGNSSDDPYGCEITEIGYHFIGGIQKHLPAICAVVAPTVNSYKRLIKEGSMSGFTWAPIFACYGNNNRTNAIRIPSGGGRVELRAADSANNPYLGAALVLAAGLEGVRDKIDPGPPHTDNMYLKTPQELNALGVQHLPRTLSEAVEAFEADPLTKEVFGDLMAKTYVDFKRNEWESYMNHVSDWERQQYLKFF